MRKFLGHTRALCLATCLAPFALPALAQDIGGSYLVEGIDFDGTPYTGVAEISVTSNVTCEVVWSVGDSESFGICMRMGDAFTVAHEIDGAIGLGIYAVMEDGTLAGTWTLAGIDAVGKEVLTPQ